MSLGAGGPGAPSPVCVPCLHGLLWFCVSCRVPPSFCDHPRRFRGRLGRPAGEGAGGGPRGGQRPSPLPAPRSPNPPRSTFPCRKRTGLNSTHGRERELGIAPLDQTAHPHSSRLGAAARQGPERLGALGRHLPPAPSTCPPGPPAQRARWELPAQDHKPSSAPAREGRAHPDSRSMSPSRPSSGAPTAPGGAS
ncbi:hypothetical protein HJG60_011765 [Phyllostomus discolor]|uniref:Uncharacterized protein n=1 Tax=Phyllostomus discolor TaxID=89673 RepID=A0A833ZNK4_9CHIR|nr:hypothetical protein HJG60_011765 [Phyllostomus discolor]